MDDTINMKEFYSHEHVTEDPLCLCLSKLLLFDIEVVAEIATRDEFGNEVEFRGVLEGVAHVVEKWTHKLGH